MGSVMSYLCSSCGHSAPRWFGRCPGCDSWGTAGPSPAGPADPVAPAVLLAGQEPPARRPTGIAELDRVLGGGLVAGSVTLLAGEPGIGKSTLALQALAGLARSGLVALLVSGEESPAQVAARAVRVGANEAVTVASTMVVPAVVEHLTRGHPQVAVIDSVQALAAPEVAGPAGSVSQVRSAAAALVGYAKASGAALILIGHVTKDGTVAGPKSLEHLVDVVLLLEGERHGPLRVLRAVKNRFGSCDEAGMFTMTEGGMTAVADPSQLMLGDRVPGVPGSIVFPTLEGSRPVLVEVQALVEPTRSFPPRRVAIGLDPRRLTMLLAVLSQRADVKLGEHDVYAAVSGGLRVSEPAVDLALCLALASARAGVPLAPGVTAIGEVGLAGEIRNVTGTPRRIAEAARFGLDTVVLPASRSDYETIVCLQATSLRSAIATALSASGDARREASAAGRVTL